MIDKYIGQVTAGYFAKHAVPPSKLEEYGPRLEVIRKLVAQDQNSDLFVIALDYILAHSDLSLSFVTRAYAFSDAGIREIIKYIREYLYPFTDPTPADILESVQIVSFPKIVVRKLQFKFPSNESQSISETFELSTNGVIDYFAYYSGMPIEMNHTDRIQWNSGTSGCHLLDEINLAYSNPQSNSDFHDIPDGNSILDLRFPIFLISLTRNETDSTVQLGPDKSPTWLRVNNLIESLVRDFRKATSRPLPMEQLPQKS